MKEEIKLTEKQKRFADFYIECGNASEAAIKAGYSERSAKVIANENLTKPYLRKYINDCISNKDNERVASQDEVLEYFTRVLRGEEKDYTISQEQKPVIGKDGKKKGYETITVVIPIPPSLKERTSVAKELAKRYGLDKKYNFDERKLQIIENQAQKLDNDIYYEVDESDEED